jgi:cobyrinic acid a,c-diamide synthase
MVRLPPRVVVAGTGSGVGKTTVATGLMAALAGSIGPGLRVAGAKVGPDFIDPGWHALATGRPGRNLDAFLCGPELLGPLAGHGAAGADVLVVEGVMGLFDGAAPPAPPELASTAQVAKLLDAPVLLVVDAAKVGRSVAAVVHGFATFDPDLRLAGVVANRVGSERHAAIVAEALEPLGIPLVGVLRRGAVPELPSRHLGLVTAREHGSGAAGAVDAIGRAVADAVDLERVLALARSAPPVAVVPWSPEPASEPRRVTVAVAGGPAFTFTYAEHLELLEAAGADVAWFDPATDARLPEGTAALYLPGGFPEVHGEQLSANEPLRAEVATFAAAGGPLVAECGGLLYLCRTLDERPMCGVLPADAAMRPRLTLGYRTAEAPASSVPFAAGARVRAHEFHHSQLIPGAGATPAWTVQGPGGPAPEGFVARSVHASYLHTHWAASPAVASRLVAAARAARNQKGPPVRVHR